VTIYNNNEKLWRFGKVEQRVAHFTYAFGRENDQNCKKIHAVILKIYLYLIKLN